MLFTTHCPKCEILKKKLNDKHIHFIENEDTLEMISFGFTEVPVLQVDGVNMQFVDAVKWVNGV